jgi:hypothetical protein
MYQNKILTLTLASLMVSVFGCTISDPSVYQKSVKKPSSGWIVSDQSDKKLADTYYFKINSYADPSISNGAKKEFSCKNSALEDGKSNSAQKISEDIIANSINSLSLNDITISIKEVRAKECRPTAVSDPKVPFSEWSQCECVITAKVDGGKSNLLARTF